MMRLSFEGMNWGDKKTILVVDDDADLRLGLDIRLKANGYNVVLATDGAESLAAAEKYAPDLILLDLGLPSGDGYSVMERLAKSAAMRLIPVIVLSARDLRPNRDRSLQGGAYTFLQKPAETAVLLDAICRAMGRAKARPTRAERKRLQAEFQVKLLNRIG